MNNYTSTDWTNQKKMDTFPATHNLPRLNNEEIENLNQLIISRDWFSGQKIPNKQREFHQ